MRPFSRDSLNFYITGSAVILLLSVISAIVVLSLTPPISRDALVHHLALPKLYLKFGRMVELPCFPYAYYPMNLDLLYGLGLLTGSDIFPKLIHGAFGLFTGVLIFFYLKKSMGNTWAVMGCLLLYCVPIVIKLSTIAYVDLGLMFFSTAALMAIFTWINSGFHTKYLYLSGICCGLAMGTKYNGLVTTFLILLLFPLAHRFAGVPWKKIGKGAMIVLIVSGAVFSPWALRNILWTGNPVYPMFRQFTPPPPTPCKIASLDTSAGRTAYNVFSRRNGLYGESRAEVSLLPLRVFFQGQDDNFQYFDGKLSPFLLLLPMFAFLRCLPKGPFISYEKKTLLLFSLAFLFIVMFFRVMRIRYFIPAIPCLVILSVYGLQNLLHLVIFSRSVNTRHLARIFITALLVYTLWLTGTYTYQLFIKYRPLSYLSGQVSKDQYIAQFRHEYPVFKYINTHLPDDSEVLFFYVGKRGYYCNRSYIPDTGNNLSALYKKMKAGDGPSALSTWLKNQGITHLMMHRGYVKERVYEDFDKNERNLFVKFLTEQTQMIYSYKAFALYKLR